MLFTAITPAGTPAPIGPANGFAGPTAPAGRRARQGPSRVGAGHPRSGHMKGGGLPLGSVDISCLLDWQSRCSGPPSTQGETAFSAGGRHGIRVCLKPRQRERLVQYYTQGSRKDWQVAPTALLCRPSGVYSSKLQLIQAIYVYSSSGAALVLP